MGSWSLSATIDGGKLLGTIRSVPVFLVHLIVLILAVFFLPVYWDEGWNFCVAKNLLEHGFYGCSLLGEPVGPRLSTGWPSVLSAYLGFELFGIGYIQGRVFIALFSFLSLVVLYFLVKRVFDRNVALTTIWVLLLFSGNTKLHPMLLGGYGMGEGIMNLFIALGLLATTYTAISIPRAILASVVASISFWMALTAKLQFTPFFHLLMLGGIFGALIYRNRAAFIAYTVTWVSTYLMFKHVAIPLPYPTGVSDPDSGTSGIIETFAINLDPRVRLAVLEYTLTYGWLLFAALVFASLGGLKVVLGRNYKQSSYFSSPVPFAMLFLATAWFGWFICLSLTFDRYLSPALFWGAPWIAILLVEGWKRWQSLFPSIGSFRNRLRLAHYILICASVLIVFQAVFSIRNIVTRFYEVGDSNANLIAAANYINAHLQPTDLVETYDVQILFLLKTRFHYPPDQFHLDSIRYRSNGSNGAAPEYDFTRDKPNLVVEGIWSRHFDTYPAIEAGILGEPEAKFGDFKIFRKMSDTMKGE